MKKVMMTDKMIWEIKDLAQQAFRAEKDFSRFDTHELQIYLILQGLERVLLRNGAAVGFEMPEIKIEDSFPVDESGQG